MFPIVYKLGITSFLCLNRGNDVFGKNEIWKGFNKYFMNLNKRYNKTGLQPVSRPVEHVPLPLGLGGWYNFPLVPRMC